MAEAEDRSSSHGSDSFPIKLPSFIPNLFPFLKPNNKPLASPAKPTAGDSQISTHDTVSFPNNSSKKNTEPLKLEAEPSSGRTSNSIVLWQVYAVGGFLVLKWAWARWNERNKGVDKKDDGDDDQPSHEDGDDDQAARGT